MPRFLAVTSRGVEPALYKELLELGIDKPLAVQGGYIFESNWKHAYKVCFQSRTATRVALTLLDFPAYEPDQLYHNVLKHDFTKYIDPDQTFAVDATVKDSVFKDSRFVALKVKDAIVDQFREKFGERPNVDKARPDLTVLVRVYKNSVSLSLDLAGEGLFKRGYRKETVLAPMKEHVAAGLLKIAQWDEKTPIVDPMCGSGTILIEAALQALRVPPGSLRDKFAFQNLKGFQKDAWDEVIQEGMDQELETLDFQFYGYDRSREAIRAARTNAKHAGVGDLIKLNTSPVDLLEPPVEHGLIIVNPPYCERLAVDEEYLRDSWRDLGFALKTRFKGWTAWILSPRKELAQQLGMKSSERHTVWNGPIQLEFLKYEVKK